MTSPAWSPPPSELRLSDDEVHVWRVALALSTPADVRHPALDAQEQDRAARFHFAEDRARFVCAHVALRDVLGRYLGRAPAFHTGPRGKPALTGSGSRGLEFNLSHSGALALIAVATWREVGVDVERCRTIEHRDIARHFFSPVEVAALASFPDPEGHQAFYRCWTRKEAYIKARGEGLALALDSFDVTLSPSAALLATRPEPSEASRWVMRELDIDDGYQAAVCHLAPAARILCFDWDGKV
jgi:4'-phosphopantetheinyl transferase